MGTDRTGLGVTLNGSLWRQQMAEVLRRDTGWGLVVSIVLHLCVIGLYSLRTYFLAEDEIPMVKVRIMKYSELGPPPSITNTEATPQVAVSVPISKPAVGIPIPVPDTEVNPDQTIATQRELSEVSGPASEPGIGTEQLTVQQDIIIEDEPDMDAFIPVEKSPVIVKQVAPVYPELARLAGVEGTVWVKILVDREGRARKAVVVKSEADLFNDAAIAAALQWVFTPAMMSTGPLAVWVAVPFHFRLKNGVL